jgi:predicted Zn-dependent protease
MFANGQREPFLAVNEPGARSGADQPNFPYREGSNIMRFFRLSNKTHRQVERYQSGLMRWLMMPFHVLGAFFNSVGATLANWWNRRNIRYLLQGLPALLVFVGIVVVTTFCVFQDRAALAIDYKREATKSLGEAMQDQVAKRDPTQSLALAQSYYNRLTNLQPDNQENRYMLARSYQQRAVAADAKARAVDERLKSTSEPAAKAELQAELEKHREEVVRMQAATWRMMASLAPSDKRGYGDAHLWMVDFLYRFTAGPDGKAQPPSPKAILEAERHLLHALTWPEETVRTRAHFYLARLYRDTGRIDEAKKNLIEVAARHPEYRLILAQWAKAQGENETVTAHAKGAEHAFRQHLTTNNQNHEARFGVVECLLLQSRFQEAEQLINEGASLAGSSTELNRAYARKLSGLLLSWCDAKQDDPRSNLLERLQLLERALALDSENPEVYGRLLALAKDKSPQSQKAREILFDLTKAKDSFLAHLFLGIDAWEQKNVTEARYHWEKAQGLAPRAPVVLNNLAWLLAFSPPVDMNRALELAEAAVKQAPQAPQFRGTRGHIYAKLGRDKEALEDLQESAKAYSKDPNLFRVLSEVCTRLGYTQMAENYKKESDRLAGLGGAVLDPTNTGDKKPAAANTELKPPPQLPTGDSKGGTKPPAGNSGSKPPGH